MKKSQIQMMESVIALGFVLVIIFLIVGALISSKKNDVDFIEEVNNEEMIEKMQMFQDMPEIKYSTKGAMMDNVIDIMKLEAFSKNLEEIKNSLNSRQSGIDEYDIKYMSKFYNIDFYVDSIYPKKFFYFVNFSLIEDNDKLWNPQYTAQVPVLLVNETNNEWNYGIVKLIYYIE